MRIEQLTFTRFVAAISIVVFHFGTNIFPFNTHLTALFFRQANVGVSYFFLLSGFVMVIAYGNKSRINPFEYYKNRFARIYPVYLLAILLLYLFYYKKNYTTDPYDIKLNLFAVQSWIPGKALSFNFPGWSISVEVLFYAIFPLLFNFIYTKKENIKKCLIPVVIFFIMSQLIFHWIFYSPYYKGYPSKIHDFIFYFPFMHLSSFLLGNMAGFFLLRKAKTSQKNYDWQILLLVVLILLALRYPTHLVFHNGVLAFLFIPMIVLFALNTGIITRILNYKLLVYLGEISYGMYILQFPIFIHTKFICMDSGIHNDTAIFYISLTALIIISSISYTFIETPLRNQIKKIRFYRNNPPSL